MLRNDATPTMLEWTADTVDNRLRFIIVQDVLVLKGKDVTREPLQRTHLPHQRARSA